MCGGGKISCTHKVPTNVPTKNTDVKKHKWTSVNTKNKKAVDLKRLFVIGLLARRHEKTLIWRRERDSNPRYAKKRIPDFESGAFDHSAISPQVVSPLF